MSPRAHLYSGVGDKRNVFAHLPASRRLGKGDPYGNGQAKTASDEPRAGPYGHQGSRSRAGAEPKQASFPPFFFFFFF